MSLPAAMKAVVFHAPYDVACESVPTPALVDDTDVIVKVRYSGICGTDLHTYRGHIASIAAGQVIGHEFTGTIAACGAAVSKFAVGDQVLATFTVQCGRCFYCKAGLSGQCTSTNTFGKTGLPGGQAEYVRVPFAESTLVPNPHGANDPTYAVMADIFITGYYGVKKILNFLAHENISGGARPRPEDVTVLQLGLGPVGLCALRVLTHLGFKKVVCVDNVPARLDEAARLGAHKVVNFDHGLAELDQFIADTNGVGFDCALEVVGATSALKTAFDKVRGDGFISSIGMAHDPLPFTGLECYLKNINVSFGRCHAWSLFPEALEMFEVLKKDFGGFIDSVIKIEDVKAGFDAFDKHQVNKVVIEF